MNRSNKGFIIGIIAGALILTGGGVGTYFATRSNAKDVSTEAVALGDNAIVLGESTDTAETIHYNEEGHSETWVHFNDGYECPYNLDNVGGLAAEHGGSYIIFEKWVDDGSV